MNFSFVSKRFYLTGIALLVSTHVFSQNQQTGQINNEKVFDISCKAETSVYAYSTTPASSEIIAKINNIGQTYGIDSLSDLLLDKNGVPKNLENLSTPEEAGNYFGISVAELEAMSSEFFADPELENFLFPSSTLDTLVSANLKFSRSDLADNPNLGVGPDGGYSCRVPSIEEGTAIEATAISPSGLRLVIAAYTCADNFYSHVYLYDKEDQDKDPAFTYRISLLEENMSYLEQASDLHFNMTLFPKAFPEPQEHQRILFQCQSNI